MSGNHNWLLIFDNLNNIESFEASKYFLLQALGTIIITSHRREAIRLGTHSVEIQELGEEDASWLLLGKLGKTPESVGVIGKLSISNPSTFLTLYVISKTSKHLKKLST